MLASPGDYKQLNDTLVENQAKVTFKEYKLGHLGLILPKDTSINDDIFYKCLAVNNMGYQGLD